MGTLNLCLKVPKKMQKTRDESNQSRLKKRQKTTENGQHMNLADFWHFLAVISALIDRIDL